MQIVLLKTDLLFFLLIVSMVFYIFFVYRDKQLFDIWRQVFRKPLATAAGMILCFYLIVCLLDSVHFRPASSAKSSKQIVSMLDLIFKPISIQEETTYSAPFAHSSFVKETIIDEDGVVKRDFVRLKYGGSHLKEPEIEYRNDILTLFFKSIVLGLVFWLFFLIIYYFFVFKEVWFSGPKKFFLDLSSSTKVFWIMLLLFCLFLSFVIIFAGQYHILGTDKVGNDVFYQSFKSVRTGVLIGTLTTLLALPFALIFGIISGYFGGWIDDLIQFIYTSLSSIPGVLLIAAAALMLEIYMAKHSDIYMSVVARADLRLLALCMIIGITSWTTLCRYVRAETLKLREMEFVAAAVALGGSKTRVLVKHIMPNLMHLVMITIVLDFSGLVLAEAALTYIDIGVDPSMESWGNMINSARLELAREPVVWWSLGSAFFFMLFLVLAANIFADSVRDAFDPKTND